MIKNGIRPVRSQPRRQVHKHLGVFGATLPINDFCVDPNIWWPDQNSERAQTECVGYEGADILCDIFKVITSPDWIYMRALQLEGVGPTTEGADPHRGLQAITAFGAPLIEQVPINAWNQGELFCANPKNWPDWVQNDATPYRINGSGTALGNGDAFTSIITAVRNLNHGVSVATLWFPEFENPDARGIVPTPTRIPAGLGGHNYSVKGMKTIDGVRYAMVKSHQGRGIGDNGWLYFNRETLNFAIQSTPTGGAFSPLIDANRLLSLINIITEDFPAAVPQLFAILRGAK